MKITRLLFVATAVLLPTAVLSAARATQTAAPSPGEVLKRAAANEEKLQAAEVNYFYRQDILVQVFGENNSVRQQLHRVSEMTYDDLGNRNEKILEYPSSQLTAALGVLQVDFKNLLGVNPFFLTTQSLPSYSTKFVRQEKIDDLNTYSFEVEPVAVTKPKERGEHLFSGKVWVDDEDFQVVKMEGRALTAKDERARFPKFECYRENVEGNLWMPSTVYAKDVLEFPKYDIPIKIVIKYTGYKLTKKRR
jgi:hypothetical protein